MAAVKSCPGAGQSAQLGELLGQGCSKHAAAFQHSLTSGRSAKQVTESYLILKNIIILYRKGGEWNAPSYYRPKAAPTSQDSHTRSWGAAEEHHLPSTPAPRDPFRPLPQNVSPFLSPCKPPPLQSNHLFRIIHVALFLISSVLLWRYLVFFQNS